MKNATVKVQLRDGAQLSFLNACAEEGNGKLTIFKVPDPAHRDATATILASLDSDNVAGWRIEESEAA